MGSLSGNRDIPTRGCTPPAHIDAQKARKLMYRDPAYLICTDNELPIEQLLQAFLWRWEIEVKLSGSRRPLWGWGRTQVRTEASVEQTVHSLWLLMRWYMPPQPKMNLTQAEYRCQNGALILQQADAQTNGLNKQV